MARLCCLPSLLPVIFALFLQTCESALNRVISQSYRATGVFLLIEGGTYYTLNFTAARDACLSLNVTMATEVQISQAIQHGLETCKYGWIAEQTAVVPRISPEQTCGQGKTGVVTWKAPADKKFGVFCFDASALTDMETTASPQSPTSPTPLTTQTTHLVTSTTRSMSSTKKSITGKSRPTLQPTPSTSASDVLVMTSRSARISSSATPSFKTFSTHIPVSLPPLLTTTNPPAVTLTFSASTHAFNFPASSEWPLPQTESSAKPSLGALHVTVIVLGIILLLLTAASAMWYFQVNVFRCLSHWQQMDNIETEMWNFTNNAMNHLGLQGDDDDDDDEEESHRMYSSDITLCVKSDIKANSSK